MKNAARLAFWLSIVVAVAFVAGCAANSDAGKSPAAPAVRPAPPAGGQNQNQGVAPVIGDAMTNSASQEVTWIPIPAGFFMMGCSPGDTHCEANENPRHLVVLPDFFMTAAKITQAQYTEVVGANPSHFVAANGYPTCPSCPVETVTWSQAEAFCQAIGGRLPTEAEWEYTARANSPSVFSCGDDPVCLSAVAWDFENANAQIHAVAQKLPNQFDLYDMLGDAFEWTGDWYAADTYAALSILDPAGPASGEYRVARGGDWLTKAAALRVSARYAIAPAAASMTLGFRCVYR
jgi:formylglycine-generating enzyme required for sulfatase activity